MRIALLLAAVLLPVSAFAEKYGSETTVTLTGTYYLVGTTTTQRAQANGDTRTLSTQTIVKITNATILQAMRTRSLIPTTTGYRLVMVAHAHLADGVAWFATPNTGTPVAIPSDLLNLNVADGPTTGQFVIDKNAVLKTLSQQTHNLANLTLGNFSGNGLLTQTWSAKTVKNGTVTEGVELVTSTGNFTGSVNSTDVGSVDFKLTGAKTVDLTRYGMATSDTGGQASADAGLTKVGGGTLTIAGANTYTGGTTINGDGTLGLTGSYTLVNGVLSFGNLTFSSTYVLTINTTTGGTATGLVVDGNGNVTQFPTFGTSLPGTLVIITSSGIHTYTHDSNGVWTPVTS